MIHHADKYSNMNHKIIEQGLQYKLHGIRRRITNMRRRNLEELAIYELAAETDSIDSSLLLDLYSDKASDIVYFTLKGKLHGIICLTDLQNRMKDGIVTINTKFSKMSGFDEEQAKKKFALNSFTKIPVVNETDCLLGDYSNLDDMDKAFAEWITGWKNIWVYLKKDLKRDYYQKIYIVNPGRGKQYLKTYIVKVFEIAKVSVTFIEKEELKILKQNTERSLIIVTDVEELRVVFCINAINRLESNSNLTYMTFINLWNHVIKCARNRRFTHYAETNDLIMGKSLLSELHNRGVNILAIYNDVYYVSDYIKNLFQQNQYYQKRYGYNRFWPVESEIGKEFFGELLENEDYRSGNAQRDISTGDSPLNLNYTSKYYNMIDGFRKTCYQPDQYYSSIYLFGPCLIRGSRVEDQYTIASQLQKRLNDEGYSYLVINRGGFVGESVFQELCRTVFHRGDIIIIFTGFNTYENIESVEIRRVFEENKVPTGWCIDLPVHMNHKATGLIVTSLYDNLKKYLIPENRATENEENIVIGREKSFRILKELTQMVYLDTWFGSIDRQVIRGGILVDFDITPFMFEQVLLDIFTLVEELIVFVAPAGNHLHDWTEYVAAILKMASPEHKIRVVPGDTFVPYQPTLPSYYTDDELAEEAVVEEARLFAECIAEPLNIQYRFGFGSGTSEKMIQYNQILKTELPKSGVQYIELK